MKKIVIRFGLYSALVEVVFFFISLIAAGVTKANYDVLKINCYPAIFVSVSFTYFGIRYYRDHVNNGLISFRKALALGMLIVVIPAICFAFSDTVYDTILDPHFYDRIEADKLKRLNRTMSASDLKVNAGVIKSQFGFYKRPAVNFAVMFITVSFFGFVTAFFSAIALRPKILQKP
jgi:hypothetical protein